MTTSSSDDGAWKKEEYDADRINQQPAPGMNVDGTGLNVVSEEDLKEYQELQELQKLIEKLPGEKSSDKGSGHGG